MGFVDALKDWADLALKQRADCTDEYRVRNGLVEPFINNVLGFNVFNMKEVVPEYLCAFGPGKTDKVDYAVFLDGKLIMIVECKGGADVTLNKRHIAQLKLYYAACETKGLVGVLTNGVQWQFFADPSVPCQMHTGPFLTFDAGDLGKTENLDLLEKLTKPKFDPSTVNTIIKGAQAIEGMKAQLAEWLTSPPDDFVTLMAKPFVDVKRIGRVIREEYRGYLKAAIRSYLDDYVEKRLPTTGQAKAIPQKKAVEMPTDSVEITGTAVASHAAHAESVTLAHDFVDGQAPGGPSEKTSPIADSSKTIDLEQPEAPKPKTIIKGADLVSDIRAGMAITAMSEKYGISTAKLSQFLHHLVLKGMLRNEELPEQTL